ncbi:hypothetical protein HY837_02100 [archaeon]|nr:hypothetical protein [archaeon]
MNVKVSLSAILLSIPIVIPACANQPVKEISQPRVPEPDLSDERFKITPVDLYSETKQNQQEVTSPQLQEASRLRSQYSNWLTTVRENGELPSQDSPNVDLIQGFHYPFLLRVMNFHEDFQTDYELDEDFRVCEIINYSTWEEQKRFVLTPSNSLEYNAHQDRVNTFLKQIFEQRAVLPLYWSSLLAEHDPEDFTFDSYFLPKEEIEKLKSGIINPQEPPRHVRFRKLNEEETYFGGTYLLEDISKDNEYWKSVYVLDGDLRLVNCIGVYGGEPNLELKFKHPLSKGKINDFFKALQQKAEELLSEIIYWKSEHQKQE